MLLDVKLVTLIVFSVTFQLPGMNSAFNASEIIGRNRRHSHLNPFKSFWCKRSTYCDADATGDDTIIDPKEGRSRLSNPFELSNEIEDDLVESDVPFELNLKLDNEIISDGRGLFPKLSYKTQWFRTKKFFTRLWGSANPLSNFMPCKSSNENLMSETGVCLLAPVCSFYGGRSTSGGQCTTGLACCASPQIATTLCLSHCQVTSGLPFSLSGNLAETSQVAGAISCSNDYIVFPGGYSLPPSTPLNQRDRYCGTLLSQVEEGTEPQTICSTAKPFRLLYRTNGDDAISLPVDTSLLGNQGFCLNFEQKLT
uniref:CUB domain-containing protein n=1 Tax=Daphnia galeata TaxID=27404 RepID=A0A8J2WI08_9CRUS|nr:unnamed protein product [Daphnia galeata]